MPRIVAWIQLVIGILLHCDDCGGGATEFSADVDAVTRPRARAQESFALGDGSHNNNVSENSVGGFGCVAAG